MIPKILHQTWKTWPLPPRFERYRQSWLRCHPDWDYRFYDDAACRSLVATHSPDLLSLYERYPTNVQRADLFRYLVIQRHGGTYADVDVECRRPLTPLLENRTCVFATEGTFGERVRRRLEYQLPYQVANSIFAAAPGHPFFAQLIARLPRITGNEPYSEAMVENTTGPRILTRVFQESRERFADVTLLPQVHWMLPTLPPYPRFFPFNINVYCLHHATGTWKLDRRDKRPLVDQLRELWHLPWPWFRSDFRPSQAWRQLQRHVQQLRSGFQTSSQK